jgi:hypothetical protein
MPVMTKGCARSPGKLRRALPTQLGGDGKQNAEKHPGEHHLPRSPFPAHNARMGKAIAWGWVEGYLILVSVRGAIDQTEWNALIADIAARRASLQGALVAPRSAPTATQRRQLVEVTQGSSIVAAILSSSPVVRAALTALNFFTRGQGKAFPPEQVDAAWSFIGAPQHLYPQAHETLAALEAKLGLKS